MIIFISIDHFIIIKYILIFK